MAVRFVPQEIPGLIVIISLEKFRQWLMRVFGWDIGPYGG